MKKTVLALCLAGCSSSALSSANLPSAPDLASVRPELSTAPPDLATARVNDLAVAVVPDLASRDLAPPMVMHTILPSTTDPAITSPNDAHLTWSSGPGNGRLFIFFPGSGAKTSAYTTFLAFVASTGYHVIELGYPNDYGSMSSICTTDTACYGLARTELWSGTDMTTKISVNADNCIHNRLDKLLAYLIATYPEEGWDLFAYLGEPGWNKITLSGHSQGGGHAAFIAAMFRVARVAMFSSVSDASNGTTPPTPADWIKQAHATPSERYFGIDHLDDKAYHDKIVVDWPLLGMKGALTDVDSEFAPYGNSQQLTASRTLTAPHSQVVDNAVPEVAGVPVYEDAWRYLIGP